MQIKQRARNLVTVLGLDTQPPPTPVAPPAPAVAVDPYATVGISRTQPVAQAVPTPAPRVDDPSVVHFWHAEVTTMRRHFVYDERWTFAYRYNKTTGEAQFGVSFCAPNDQFVRATGRRISAERLEATPVTLALLPDLSWTEVCEAMSTYLTVPGVAVPGMPSGIVVL